jgi:aminomethyltransferase
MSQLTLKRTPLFTAHQRAGGRLIEFGGWEMPVQYSSIVDEHLCVRRAAGIFDISHMGEARVAGAQAAAFLNATLTNDITKLAVGQGQYTLMCNEHGGVIDDLYAYRIGEQEFLLVINASRIEADVAWLTQRHGAFTGRVGVELQNISDALGAVAVQGPRVAQFIDACFPGGSTGGTHAGRVTELRKNEIGQWQFNGQPVWIGRTGYTGEDGFEIITAAELIEAVWAQVLAQGHVGCLQPCGLGARDTLRTEVCFPLYGHELDENTTPIEAGLGVFVALEKGEFVGRDVLARQKAEGVAKRSVAFRMTAKSAPPRPGYAIWAGGAPVGTVVSGTQSPSLNCGIGLGYVPPQFAAPGTKIEIEIRGQCYAAEVVKKPIYRKV